MDLSDHGQLVNSSKKQVNIAFPLVGLNMSKHIAPSAKANNKSKQIYNLYGVSNHYGSLSAGHYTSFCKSRVFQKWVIMHLTDTVNDSILFLGGISLMTRK